MLLVRSYDFLSFCGAEVGFTTVADIWLASFKLKLTGSIYIFLICQTETLALSRYTSITLKQVQI